MIQNPSTTQVIQQVVEPVRAVSPEMKAEPARTVGKEIDKKYTGSDDVRLLISALFAVAVAGGIQVAPGLEQSVQNIVSILAPALLALYARYATERTKSRQAKDQAEQTREVVYSEASVEDIVAVAKRTQ